MSGLGVGKGLGIAMTWMTTSITCEIVMRMVVDCKGVSGIW